MVPNGPGTWTNYAQIFLRFVPAWNKGLDNDPTQLMALRNIDKDAPQMDELRQIFDATDTDLSAFRRHGGKLVMYYGWADPQLNPRMGVE